MKKIRLDDLTVLSGLAPDLPSARRLIMAGEVRSGDRVWEKAGEKIATNTVLELKSKHCRWVSRGGLKLEKALNSFKFEVNGWRCLDIGASTGGFTDVLLFFGAAQVVAVDVGYGLLDAKLQNDPRVLVKDRTNFRLLATGELGEPFDLAVTDVSFISLTKILPNAVKMLKESGSIIALIKPQFEAPRHLVPEGGIVIDPQTHKEVIVSLQKHFASDCQLYLHDIAAVPLVNRKKNIEFLSLWKSVPTGQIDAEKVTTTVHAAHQLIAAE